VSVATGNPESVLELAGKLSIFLVKRNVILRKLSDTNTYRHGASKFIFLC